MARKTPEQKAAEARSKAATQGARTRAHNRVVATATDQREKFEANNPQRGQRIEDMPSMVGSSTDPNKRMTTRQVYRAMGYTDNSPTSNHQMELTSHDGSEVFQGGSSIAPHRDLMPVNRRWHEYSPHEQERIIKAASRYGVTPESAHRNLAAQVDQAYLHEGGHHDSFYSPEHVRTDSGSFTPRYRLKASAEENKVPFGVQAAANAITSPQNTFAAHDKATGQIRYPNDEAASHAIQWAKSGKTGDEYKFHPDYYVPNEDKIEKTVTSRSGKSRTVLVKHPDDPRKYPVQGYPENAKTAIDVTHKVLSGTPLRNAWKPTDAEKVTAYHNAWVDPHGSSQFWVSDTHSGGAAFAPHLDKSEQTKYMGIKGIHAWHDHLADNVMAERGLNSKTNTQSAQWSQEKRERGDGHDDALNNYKTRNLGSQFGGGQIPGQGTLFS